MSQPDEEADKSRQTMSGIMTNSTYFYGVMAAIGLMIMHFVHGQLLAGFTFGSAGLSQAEFVAFAVLGAGVLLTLSFLFEAYVESFKALKDALVSLFGRCHPLLMLYLAAISAAGEELLFRGAIQPFAGLGLTSVLFGLLHLGPNFKPSSWTVWAFLSGLLLGWMYESTGSLWAPIICHFVVNAASMLRMRFLYRRQLASKKSVSES